MREGSEDVSLKFFCHEFKLIRKIDETPEKNNKQWRKILNYIEDLPEGELKEQVG